MFSSPEEANEAGYFIEKNLFTAELVKKNSISAFEAQTILNLDNWEENSKTF